MVEEYDLKETTKFVGRLYPILLDKEGTVIDGLHRQQDPDWPKHTVEHVDTELKRLVARLITNVARRSVPKEEKTWIVTKMAQILEEAGIERGQIANEIAKLTGFTERWARDYLPSDYKRDYTTPAPKPETERRSELEKQPILDVGVSPIEESDISGKPKTEEVEAQPESILGANFACGCCGQGFKLFHLEGGDHLVQRVFMGEVPDGEETEESELASIPNMPSHIRTEAKHTTQAGLGSFP